MNWPLIRYLLRNYLTIEQEAALRWRFFENGADICSNNPRRYVRVCLTGSQIAVFFTGSFSHYWPAISSNDEIASRLSYALRSYLTLPVEESPPSLEEEFFGRQVCP